MARRSQAADLTKGRRWQTSGAGRFRGRVSFLFHSDAKLVDAPSWSAVGWLQERVNNETAHSGLKRTALLHACPQATFNRKPEGFHLRDKINQLRVV
jgi:hypothetical protein